MPQPLVHPTTVTRVDFLTAASFLRYSSALQVVRTADSGALNAVDSGAAELVKNDEDWDNGTWTANILAKHPGPLGDNLAIKIADSTGWSSWSASYKAQFDAAPTGQENTRFGSRF